jgi:nicotinamidase-related amidase
LIVDVQVAVMQNAWEAPRIITNLARAVAQARAEGVPVIWVQHADSDLPEGSEGWAWVPELGPQGGEVLIHKGYNSAFEGQPRLEDTLAGRGVSHLFLGGASTNWCIRATAYAALERGYDLSLLNDGHSNSGLPAESGRAVDAETLVHELNVALTWLGYPGRSNGTVSVAELNFQRPAGRG